MFKKNFIVIYLVFILSILNTNIVSASSTDGIINSVNKYAWGENIGWLNFGLTDSGVQVHVTDNGLTGFVWSEKYGWINLNPNNENGGKVTNNGQGILGGNAWGEKLGWISFSGVTINSSGEFLGYATIIKDNSRISLNCSNTNSCNASNFKVSTDWRPASMPNQVVQTNKGGGYYQPSIILHAPSVVSAEKILGSGVCPLELIITDNMKKGVRNGLYSDYNKGIIKQVNILQAHINRILAASYKQAAGPTDGIFGLLTEQGVKRLQVALNTIIKPKPLLEIDGIVGPFTKAAINNSCGNLSQFSMVKSAVIPSIISKIQKVNKNLQLGSNEKDVKALQLFLVTQNKMPVAKIIKSSVNIKTYINTSLKIIKNKVINTYLSIKTIFINWWHFLFN